MKMKDNKDTDIIFKQTMSTMKEEEQESPTQPLSREKEMTKKKEQWPVILKTFCMADLREIGFYYKSLLYITRCRTT